jgi:hypothetical protein
VRIEDVGVEEICRAGGGACATRDVPPRIVRRQSRVVRGGPGPTQPSQHAYRQRAAAARSRYGRAPSAVVSRLQVPRLGFERLQVRRRRLVVCRSFGFVCVLCLFVNDQHST